MPRISDGLSSLLDFIRGVSAQVVVIGHLLTIYGLNNGLLDGWKVQNFGVMVFFILSGFLIFYTAVSKGTVYGIGRFLIDRTARIFTPLIPSLILIVLVDYFILKPYSILVNNWSYTGMNFLLNVILMQNHPVFLSLFDSTSFGSGRPLWTVSVEWIFYICFAIVFYWNQSSSKRLVRVLSVYFMLAPLFYISGRGAGLTIYWLLGLMVGVIYTKNIKVTNSTLGTFLIVLFGISAFIYRAYTLNLKELYDVGLAFCITIILYGLISMISIDESAIHKLFRKSKVLNTYLASFSYSLYLVHYTLIYLFMVLFNEYSFKYSIILNYVLVNVISYLFYLVFERHYSKVKSLMHSVYNKLAS